MILFGKILIILGSIILVFAINETSLIATLYLKAFGALIAFLGYNLTKEYWRNLL